MGFRHSWMSREIACFGAFAGLAVAYAIGAWANPLLEMLGLPALDPELGLRLQRGLGGAVALTGLLGVLCSAMLYAVTRRVFWRFSYSGPRFLGTSALLGLSLTLLTFSAAAYFGEPVSGVTLAGLCETLFGVAALKLLMDASVLAHLKSAQVSDLKRTALLMWGELSALTQARFLVGVVGGLGIPVLLPVFSAGGAQAQVTNAQLALAAVSCLLLVGGELIERSLFFMAAASPKMPGAIGK